MKKITIIKDGPYLVDKEIPFNRLSLLLDGKGDGMGWQLEETYPPQEEDYYLCRCGHSPIYPFCNGTHELVGFKGDEVASKENYASKAKLYTGETLDLQDWVELCSKARICLPHGDTWHLVFRSSDPKRRALALQQVADCPSGRLVALEKDGTPLEPKLAQEISLLEYPDNECEGTYWVKGGIKLFGSDGALYEVRNRMALCSCGDSENMPYCDGHHEKSEHMKNKPDNMTPEQN